MTSLHAQLRVLQAARPGTAAEPTGHAVRMDALHLIRAAAEFADTMERDAQGAAAKQIARAEQQIREREKELQRREAAVVRVRQETDRERAEILNAARTEAREITTKANREAAAELRSAEAAGARLLEQARHEATELTNAVRAEVERTLAWARAEANAIVERGRLGAEQLLSAAGRGEVAVQDALDAIVRAAEAAVPASRRRHREDEGGERRPRKPVESSGPERFHEAAHPGVSGDDRPAAESRPHPEPIAGGADEPKSSPGAERAAGAEGEVESGSSPAPDAAEPAPTPEGAPRS